MNKLTIKEVAKAQGLYLFSNCMWTMSYRNNDDVSCWDEPREMNYHDVIRYTGREDWIKPVLTPLSHITDEDVKECCQILFGEPGDYYKKNNFSFDPTDYHFKFVKDAFTISNNIDLLVHDAVFTVDRYWSLLDYLKQKGYAVPLWFGIDHWANGQTAIELNIAIEKP